MANPNTHLLPEVRKRIESLDLKTTLEWGGMWYNGSAAVNPIEPKYNEHTQVRSANDAVEAFEKYTDYWESVCSTFESSNDSAVVLPCGSQKPIGSSAVHRKKLDALRQGGYTDEMDILIMSEPCVIIPHGQRLSMPAVNYDFPPEYTEEESHTEVFNIFVKRLAKFIEQQDYGTYYTYLVNRHQNKFSAAMERVSTNVRMVEVPGASYNPESGAYCGDMFQSTENVARKLRAVRGDTVNNADAASFYASRNEYALS